MSTPRNPLATEQLDQQFLTLHLFYKVMFKYVFSPNLL